MAGNSLILQQVTCPNCNRPINTFNPKLLIQDCPYCHGKLVNRLVEPKSVPVPERIIPFTTNEQTFENALVNALINQDYVPTNIFDSIQTDHVIQAYLPMYLFEGTYNASWSCESSYMSEKSTSNGSKDVKKWRPQNGNTAGNFSFLCLANEGEEIPDELRKFTSLFPYDVMMSKEFEPDMIDYNDDNLITLERNTDPTLVWQKHGKDMVEETARQSALVQIGSQEIRNFRASSSYNLSTTGKYILVPFWFVYYKYNDSQYHFIMDGIGQRTEYSYPVNQEEIDFVNNKERINKLINWLWLIALVLWYFFNFTAAIVYLVIWFVVKIIARKKIEGQIIDRLEQSKEQRKKSADRL